MLSVSSLLFFHHHSAMPLPSSSVQRWFVVQQFFPSFPSCIAAAVCVCFVSCHFFRVLFFLFFSCLLHRFLFLLAHFFPIFHLLSGSRAEIDVNERECECVFSLLLQNFEFSFDVNLYNISSSSRFLSFTSCVRWRAV